MKLCDYFVTMQIHIAEWLQVPNHRQLAYGVAAVQDTAWTGLRSTEATRFMQRMLLAKVSGVGILKRSRYEPTPHLLTAHAFGFTSSHVEQYGMHATGRHRSGSIVVCISELACSCVDLDCAHLDCVPHDCTHMRSQGDVESIDTSEEELEVKPKAEGVLILIAFINSCVHLDCNQLDCVHLDCAHIDCVPLDYAHTARQGAAPRQR